MGQAPLHSAGVRGAGWREGRAAGLSFFPLWISSKAALEYQCQWERERIQTAGITSGGQSPSASASLAAGSQFASGSKRLDTVQQFKRITRKSSANAK